MLKDKRRVEDIKALVDRLNGRLSMLGTPFERKSVSSRFGQNDHLTLKSRHTCNSHPALHPR